MEMKTLPERFEDTAVDIVTFGGEKWLRGPQIAEALGFQNPSKAISDIYTRNKSEFDDSTNIMIEMPTGSGRQIVRLYNARGAALIAMKARTPKGEAFRRWVLDVLEGLPGVDEDAPLKPVEGFTADVLTTLRRLFYERKGMTALVRYLNLGLGTMECSRLLGVSPV